MLDLLKAGLPQLQAAVEQELSTSAIAVPSPVGCAQEVHLRAAAAECEIKTGA